MTKNKMIRKQIYLESEQNDHVKVLSARKGKTEAEIIREALDKYITTERKITEDPLTQLFGLVKAEADNGSTSHDQAIYFPDSIEASNEEK